jgi:hypothetical protein
VTALATDRERNAGRNCFAVDQDRARTALATIAAGFHTGEVNDFAQIVDE